MQRVPRDTKQHSEKPLSTNGKDIFASFIYESEPIECQLHASFVVCLSKNKEGKEKTKTKPYDLSSKNKV